jgi:succinoglycan biosynthesis transport protein ExoP
MNRADFFDVAPSASWASRERRLTVIDLLQAIRRQFKLIVLCVMGSVLVMGLYLVTAQKWYTAEATLLIDPRRLQIFRQDSVTSDLSFDSATLESQLETLRSEKLARMVVTRLDLHKEPEFIGSGPSLVGLVVNAVLELFDDPPPVTEERNVMRAVAEVRRRIDVRRSGMSYAIVIRFRAHTAGRAAQVANEIAEAYILDQIESRFELTQRASVWLQGRIAQLQQQASDAERAVADFKAVNQIVDANGRLISEVQLQEAQTQESVARQARQEARARLDRLREIIGSGIIDATVADALRSEILIRLRQEFLELTRRESDWSARFGANHQSVIQIRGDLRRLERSMQDELKRIQQTYESDFQIAVSKEQAVRDEIEQLRQRWNDTRQAQVRLRELETTAQSWRTLHDSFMQRYNLAVQQQSFAISDGRIITNAVPPSGPSWPRNMLMLAGAIILGSGLGGAIGLFREINDKRVRITRDLEDATGVDCVGILPTEERRSQKASVAAAPTAAPPSDPATPILKLNESKPIMSQALQQPFGLVAETCRNVKVSIDVARMLRKIRTIGITSANPGEGKTATSSNIGFAIARSGSRVLVIDVDLRKPNLTQSLMPDATKGLVEVLLGKESMESVLWREPVSGCYFLPTVLTLKLSNTSDILSSKAMQDLLAEAAEKFEYVFLDCPPVSPIADVRSFAHHVDAFFLVAAWGETNLSAVERVGSADFIKSKLLGTVMSKVNLKSYRLFESFDESYYSSEFHRTH